MSSLRSGLVSITFRTLTVPQIVEAASNADLAAIEWGGDVHCPPGDLAAAKDAKQRTAAAGLTVSAYGSYYRAGVATETFDAVLASAVELGAPTIRIWAGNKGSAESDAGHVQAVTDDIARVCDLAAGRGITITLEYHGGTLTDTFDGTLNLLKTINKPNLLTGWQPRDGKSAEEGAAEIRQLRPWLGNIHVFQWWPTGQTRWPLANGAERWATFLNTVAEDRKPRYALLEFVMNDDPEQLLVDAKTLNGLIG